VSVSVVIPVKDVRPLLVRAVRSALDQGELVSEIIVIDDQSSDGSAEAVAGMDSRVKILKGKGTGPADARNMGVKVAASEIVAFMDADDYWTAGGLLPRYELFKKHPRATLVFSDAVLLDRMGRELGRMHVNKPVVSGSIYSALLLDNFIPTSSVLVPAKVFERTGGFQTDFQPAEDYRLWLRLAALGPCMLDPNPRIGRCLRDAAFGADRLAGINAQTAVLEDSLAAERRPYLAQWPPLRRRLLILHHVRAQLLARQGRKQEALAAYDAARKWGGLGLRIGALAMITKTAFPLAKRLTSLRRLGLT